MAEKRMFAKSIIDSDAFLEMPATSQLLYFHLSMRADDDGFINKPNAIMKMIGVNNDDLNILFLKKFVIPFESGVVVIKHWRINNYIRNDTYHETNYKEEKNLLEIDENGAYTMPVTYPLQNRNVDKISIDKNRLDKNNRFVKPTLEEVKSYCDERSNHIDPQRFIDYYDSVGWKVGNKPMKDWKACIRTWEQRNKKEKSNDTLPTYNSQNNTYISKEEANELLELMGRK